MRAGFTPVIVEEEERALWTMAAYVDLNRVRAGMVFDPADYRWSGDAEAMAEKARARRGLVRIIGRVAWPKMTIKEWWMAQGLPEGETLEKLGDTGASAPGGAPGGTRGGACAPPRLRRKCALHGEMSRFRGWWTGGRWLFYLALLGGKGNGAQP